MPDPRPTPPSLPAPLVFQPRRAMSDPRPDDRVRQELLTHLAYLREDVKTGFAGVHARLDTQNGRINGLEKRESAHHERIGALEEESTRLLGDTAPHESKKRTAVTLSLGAGGGALLIKLIELAAKAMGGS